MVNSFCVLETVSLIGEVFRVLDNTLWEMQWEEAEALRLFSEGRRAHVGEFPSCWLG